MSLIVAGVAIVASVVGGFIEHKRISAEISTVEAKVKASVAADVAKVVADIKAWQSTAVADAKSVIDQFEGRLKQVL